MAWRICSSSPTTRGAHPHSLAGIRDKTAQALYMFEAFTNVHVGHIHTLAIIVAYAPLAISLLTLILPLDGWWWEQRAGGRSPSERERLIYEDAIAQLQGRPPERMNNRCEP